MLTHSPLLPSSLLHSPFPLPPFSLPSFSILHSQFLPVLNLLYLPVEYRIPQLPPLGDPHRMPLILLLFLVLACLPLSWPEPLWGGEYAPLITLACVLLSCLGMGGISYRTHLLLQNDRTESAWRWYAYSRTLMFYLNLALYYTALLVGGWGYLARDWLTLRGASPEDDFLLPAAELLVLAPYFCILVASWLIFYSCERALRGREFRFTRRSYVLFAFRQNLLLVLIPLGMIVLQSNLFRLWPELLESVAAKGIGLLTAFIVMGILPLFLPQILGLKRLDDPELRQRLDLVAQRVGVRYREIYLWETRGHLATALVAGLFAQARIIIFTDGLLRMMPTEELESVFGHELGHARHGHIHFYGLFLVLSFATIGAAYHFATQVFPSLQGLGSDLMTIAILFTTGLYLFLVFGFLSRKCERQADLMGCRALHPQLLLTDHGIEVFTKALDRVGNINSSHSEDKTTIQGPLSFLIWLAKSLSTWLATWQHGTLESRMAYLNRVRQNPRLAERFQWYVFALRWCLFLLLCGTLGFFLVFGDWRAILQGL